MLLLKHLIGCWVMSLLLRLGFNQNSGMLLFLDTQMN
ncbi:hypothetical protein GLYMA_08G275250v4 [Glycine max]|nr:hypothetical protein GLYMA_08G275250v4 [Glycine max]KAG4399640.1 hypothetical protein GLYMA_08G275250v4 [Glycine max]KAH1053371.1 hypothetical protein GYH30_022592 [Glycine max]KAH1053372.1 hypothetical protein GYH30_022592 [Glycine max]